MEYFFCKPVPIKFTYFVLNSIKCVEIAEKNIHKIHTVIIKDHVSND